MSSDGLQVAVVGMALRVPGADSLGQFWSNLSNGIESVTRFDPAEVEVPRQLAQLGAGAREVLAGGILDEPERFDAEFFGVSPHEAQLIDPQHRKLVEVAHEAFENAGILPGQARTGVFAGAGFPTYPMTHLWNSPDLEGLGLYWLTVGNDKDHIATRVAYCLQLNGSAVTVQSACSTALACVHLACQSLLTGESDVAVAGSSAIGFPQRRPYHVVEGGILSPEGTCRPFDARAAGTVPGSGVVAVVLKRMDDAQRDGDPIHAVIRGTAVGSDTADRLSYAAPSVSGQVHVLSEALAVAGVDPGAVSYIEAHGTGTPLGDPIEIAALAKALPGGPDEGPCWIGSVKANLGHLDVAAGLAGLVKTILALEHESLPPTVGFEAPNPRLHLDETRFRVTASPVPWPRGAAARIAGVSAFGLGGTNAHVVIEEAPVRSEGASCAARGQEMPLLLSAGDATALDGYAGRVADALGDLAATARTLAFGRRHRSHRRVVVAASADAARQALRAERRIAVSGKPSVGFVFCGAGRLPGAESVALLEEPAFAAAYRDAERALAACGARVVTPAEVPAAAGDVLARPTVALPALFAAQVALARLWEHLGVRPRAVCGHSAGEFAAAHVAGALPLADAAALITERARLLETAAPGRIGLVQLPYPEAEALAREVGVHVAAVNTPDSCTLTGDDTRFEALLEHVERAGIDLRIVGIATAAHTPLLRAAGAELAALASRAGWQRPAIPYVSGAVGGVLSDEELLSPRYWGEHLWRTVQFSDAVAAIGSICDTFVEIGPAGTVQPFVSAGLPDAVVVASLPHPRETVTARARLLESLGALWARGVDVDWDTVIGRRGRRAALPSAPLRGPRYLPRAAARERGPRAQAGGGTWLSTPVWRRAGAEPVLTVMSGRWLVYDDGSPLAAALASQIDRLGASVERIALPPSSGAARDRLVATATGPLSSPVHGIVYFWGGAAPAAGPGAPAAEVARALDLTFVVPFELAKKVLATVGDATTRLIAVAPKLASALDGAGGRPYAALTTGPFVTVAREHPGVSGVVVDADPAVADAATVTGLLTVAVAQSADELVVLRSRSRWVRGWERAAEPPEPAADLGVTLVTGGLGGIGLAVVGELAASGTSRIAVLSRRDLSQAHADDPVTAALTTARGTGAEVLVVRADVADPERLAAAVAEVTARLGPVETVIHAAGVPGGGMIGSRSLEDCLAVLAPKVDGTRALAAALAGHPVRRVLLCSALDGVLGTLGQVDHVAANAFLDLVPGTGWFGDATVSSVDWGAWRDVGQAANLDRLGGLARWRTAVLADAIPPDRGAALAVRLLSWPGGVIAASPRDIEDLMAQARATDVVALYSQPDGAATASAPRRLPEATYRGPEGPVQQTVAALWSAVIGVAPVGVDDDYFALGGHSLAAIALVSRLRQIFPFPIGLPDILNRPTVAAQAVWLEQRVDAYVADLPEDEVERLLASDLAQEKERGHGP
jgi:acyl transferase domain-containing protein